MKHKQTNHSAKKATTNRTNGERLKTLVSSKPVLWSQHPVDIKCRLQTRYKTQIGYKMRRISDNQSRDECIRKRSRCERTDNIELLVAARLIDPERNCSIGGSGEANHGLVRSSDTTGHDSSYAKCQVRDSHGATGHGVAEQGSSSLDNIVAAMSAAFKQRSSQNHVYCEPAIEALHPSSTAAAFCRSHHFRSWLAQYEAYGVPAAKRRAPGTASVACGAAISRAGGPNLPRSSFSG